MPAMVCAEKAGWCFRRSCVSGYQFALILPCLHLVMFGIGPAQRRAHQPTDGVIIFAIESGGDRKALGGSYTFNQGLVNFPDYSAKSIFSISE
jgi:hypothetical protein